MLVDRGSSRSPAESSYEDVSRGEFRELLAAGEGGREAEEGEEVAAHPSAWLHQFERLRIRYEIRADLHLGLLQLARSIICLRRLRTSC